MLRKLLFLFIFILCILLGAAAYLMERDWVDFSALDAYKSTQPTIVLDDDGAELTRFELDRRTPVLYHQMPDVLVKAFVAAEDHQFFEHGGISMRGIVRSMLVNLYHLRVVQGASTITQQLAKLMFLTYERTWWRKAQEIFLAFQLERQLSKEQILELYLNNIYFGRGIYGVEAACKRFWNKELAALTPAEAATLAAVAKSARLYSPLNAPGNAKRRRDWVLGNMCNLGFIDDKQHAAAVKQQLQITDYAPGNPMRLYVSEWIRLWAEAQWGKDVVYRQGLKIKTTINRETQEKAERAFGTVMYTLRAKLDKALNGGLVSLDPASGAIKAMIGGYDFRESQYNRAFVAQRPMGSSFKPVVYALALRAGIEMDTVFVDEPLELTLSNGTVYKPKNWTNKFEGPMTLVRALTTSNNIITLKLFLKLGAQYVVPWARLFGITRQLNEYPSTALGTAEATVEENAAAFNVFANNGVYAKPYLVEWVKDAGGTKVFEAEPMSRRVLDATVNAKMVNLLAQRMLVAAQREQRAWPEGNAWFDAESIGKTGSTNGASTTWFVGATPALTTALYVGCDDNRPMGERLFANATTMPIWTTLYKSLKHAKKSFYKDPSLKPVAINWFTGALAAETDSQSVVLLQ